MSEEENVVKEETAEDVETTAQDIQSEVLTEERPQLQLNDLKVGYVVGMTEEGNFVFDVFGKERGLVEVLGLHQHASYRVQQIHNQTQMAGDALVHEVGKALTVLNQKLEAIQQVVAPKKPDNNL